MVEQHDIPEWFIPGEEQVIANEHEKEQIEERGEVTDPLCPHCGNSYEKESEGYYIHAYRPVDGEWGDWQPKENGRGMKRSTNVTPSIWCNPSGEKGRDLECL